MLNVHRHLKRSTSVGISDFRRFLSPISDAGSVVRRQNLVPIGNDAKDRGVHWVFLGCPGVGKGTYASRLSSLLGVAHIATGDLVRQELSTSGPFTQKMEDIVNQGKLVSDDIIMSLLSKRLATHGHNGFILDGFPRTVDQAEMLDCLMPIDLVVNLKLPESVLIQKCLGRRICSECGDNFNIATIAFHSHDEGTPTISMPPLLPPPHCMSKLVTRSDDTEHVVQERLRVYSEKSKDIEGFYRKQGKLLEFDLPGGIAETWRKLLDLLNLEEPDEEQQSAAA